MNKKNKPRIGSIVRMKVSYHILENIDVQNRYGIVVNIYDYEHEAYEQLVDMEEDYEIEIQGYPQYRRWFSTTEFEIIYW